MSIKPFVLLMVLLFFPVAALGSDKAAWMGPGITWCADFAKACAGDPANAKNLFFSWALGFMSGLNTELLQHGETDLKELPQETQKKFLRSYCEAHPRASYLEAVFNLYNRMRHDQGLPNYLKTWHEPPKGR